jgi:hypothetical protein
VVTAWIGRGHADISDTINVQTGTGNRIEFWMRGTPLESKGKVAAHDVGRLTKGR